MLRDARIVARKDLQLEWRSRIATNQILPFAVLVLVVFAFAVDADAAVLRRIAPGLFWVALLLSTLLAAGRSAALEAADGLPQGLRLSGLEPSGVFLGKATALVLQLLVVAAILTVGIVVFYDVGVEDVPLYVITVLTGTVTLAAVGTIYGALSLGSRVRETLLPLLVIPAVAPVLLAGARANERALGQATGSGWSWVGLLALIAVVYVVAGLASYGPLLEET
ncbi:MAG: heme exporter protein CcmB [Actinomycetota bacterium]